MGTQKLIAAACIVAGLLLLGLAVLYWVEPARSLPAFLPGHEAGSAVHHSKHGLLALALAVIAFLIAWFQSGPRPNTIT